MDIPYARNKNNRTETIIKFAGYILYMIYSGFKSSTFTFRNMHSNNYYLLFKKDYLINLCFSYVSRCIHVNQC